MILDAYVLVGAVGLLVLGLTALAIAALPDRGSLMPSEPAWRTYRFGFATYALIFVAFDMEMIFMYPWAVVFAGIGMKAFLDMLVFIALLGGGITFAWGMGGLDWE